MWPHRSEVLAPLSRLTSKKILFQWMDTEQKAFNEMLKIIGKNVLLSYPNFNKKLIFILMLVIHNLVQLSCKKENHLLFIAGN